MSERLYGLDWLRIGAFGLLIFYHIGMFFVTWEWHIKAPNPLIWVEIPMLALSPWRLSLLFLISGVASAFLLSKLRPGAFARSRSARLLIPLLAGMVLFVPPQPWVELIVKHGYAHGFAHFWTQDYFRFGKLHGLDLPTWNHLWFVAYLWVYTMVLGALAATLTTPASQWLASTGEAALGSWRVLALPILLLWGLWVALYPIFPETHALVDDWYNHASYGLVFGIGVLLAHSVAVRESFKAHRRWALVLSLLGYAGVCAFELAHPDEGPAPAEFAILLARAARSCQTWGAIVALVGYALTWKVGDSPARRYLTEAIFPYYIAHQTIIVLAAYALKPLGLANSAMFLILVLATVAGCAISYELARRSGPLRPMLGLKATPWKRRSNMQPAVAD